MLLLRCSVFPSPLPLGITEEQESSGSQTYHVLSIYQQMLYTVTSQEQLWRFLASLLLSKGCLLRNASEQNSIVSFYHWISWTTQRGYIWGNNRPATHGALVAFASGHLARPLYWLSLDREHLNHGHLHGQSSSLVLESVHFPINNIALLITSNKNALV